MLLYRCRHAVFSKYFGDSSPLCKNRCDVCKNKDEVQARIAQFEMCQTRSKKSRSNLGSVMQMNYSDDEMYVKNCLNLFLFIVLSYYEIMLTNVHNYTITIGIHLMNHKNRGIK